MKRTGKVTATRVHSVDGDNMDIGSSLWMRDIDRISHQIKEGLSLEGVIVTQRATELQSEARKLARQRAFLREERRRARMEEELLRQEVADFALTKKEDWIPLACFARSGMDRVRLNVGGQIFEVSKVTLQRDSASLLAALCEGVGPLKDGMAYVDRDWWTFRHILSFFRDGTLPSDAALLTQLYREAGYWRCETLKCAIEEQLHLYRAKFDVNTSGTSRQTPTEYKGNMDTSKDAKRGSESSGKCDWWTASCCNSRHLSTPNSEMVTPSTDGREKVGYATFTTWGDKDNLDAKGRLCCHCECSRSASRGNIGN